MRSNTVFRWAATTAWLACALTQSEGARGDEPGRLGRLFRLGSAGETSKPATPSGSVSTPIMTLPTTGSTANTASPYRSVGDSYAPPALSTATTTPPGTSGLTPAPRIAPKARTTKAITEADPLVSRISLGHADGGSQFAMFVQVFADGTVIDGEGVHKISPEMLKPVVEAVSSGEFAKLKGHCGGPAGDTFETIHVVTYERAYGRLRANAFSYSGNPQGCDHAVHHLHKVLEELQIKMSTPGGTAGTAASMTPMVVSPPLATSPAASAPPTTMNPLPLSPASTLPMPNLPDPGLH